MGKTRAEKRIQRLFNEAKDLAKTNQDRADRYAELAWNIKLKANATFTPYQKMHFCKQCKRYLPASKLRVRLNNGVITRTCTYCNDHVRIPYHETN